MSEKRIPIEINKRPEKYTSVETEKSSEMLAGNKEALDKHTIEKTEARKMMQEILEKAEKKPRPTEKNERRRHTASAGVKKQQYKATMRRVEARLPVHQKIFSKIIHNPAVDNAANIASKTIARPSGLLGGALAAFFGLTLLYLNARRVGFEYSTGSAFIFFVSLGWLIGLLIEYLVGAFKRIINKT